MTFLFSKIARRIAHSFFNVCCVVGVLLCMYSISSPRWYGAETHRGPIATDPNPIDGGLAISPWYTCGRADGLWQCEQFTITGLGPFGTCAARTEATLGDFTYAIRAMVIITGVSLALASIVDSAVAGFGPTYIRAGANTMIGLSVLALAANIAGIVIAAVFYKDKLYCEDGFCKVLKAIDPTIESCEDKFFAGGLCFIVGIICPAFAVVTSVYLRAVAGRVADAASRPPKLRPHQSNSNINRNNNRNSRRYEDDGNNNDDDGNAADMEMRRRAWQQSDLAPAAHTRTQSTASNPYVYGNGGGRPNLPPNSPSNNNNPNSYSPAKYGNANGYGGGAIDVHDYSVTSPNAMGQQRRGGVPTPMQSTSSPTHFSQPVAGPLSPTSYRYEDNHPQQGGGGAPIVAARQPSPRGGGNSTAEEPSFHGASGPAVAEGQDVTFQPPEGDWEWDPNSNMYWSESQYLFLNPNDGHFFDPNSEQWYNPETEEWYA